MSAAPVQRRPACSASRQSSASGDAERERELGCQDHSRPDERERAARPACCEAPLTFEQTGEGAGRERDREHAEQPYSDKCGERVVEDAVVDEGVTPGVPEVVPEREAVQEEEPALVLVRREVAAARAEPDEQRRGDRPEPGAEQGFARDRHPPGPPRRASVGRERDVPHGREAYVSDMRGALAAGHPLTAEAGADVLRAGGNAVDACIAAAAVSWICESPLTGPGGGGFLLVHTAREARTRLLDFFVAVPERTASPEDLVGVVVDYGDSQQSFYTGPMSVAVPGAVLGLWEAHRRWGSVPWAELLAPAAKLAREGVVLNEVQAFLHRILDPLLRYSPEGDALYGHPAGSTGGEAAAPSEKAWAARSSRASGSPCRSWRTPWSRSRSRAPTTSTAASSRSESPPTSRSRSTISPATR